MYNFLVTIADNYERPFLNKNTKKKKLANSVTHFLT
jgi:hypothetical protein